MKTLGKIALWTAPIMACVLGLALPAFASEISPSVDVSSYYRSPQPEKLPDFLMSLSTQPIPEESIDLYAVFLATALDRAPDQTENAFTLAATLPREQTELALKTAWLMHDGAGKKFLQMKADMDVPDAADMLRTPAPDFKTVKKIDEFYLDCFWIIFLASGEEWPVLKVISVLENKPESMEQGVIAGAARWSLTSNAKQHPKVLEIIKKARQSAPPYLASELDEVLQAK